MKRVLAPVMLALMASTGHAQHIMELRGDCTTAPGSPKCQAIVTANKALNVELGGQNLGAFGDLLVAEKTAIVQMDFVYGLHPQLSTYTATNSASVAAVDGLLTLQSSTTTNGAATFFSKLPARYRAGQGISARFTVLFTTGVAQSTQTVGMADNGDGYFFGYNGDRFGVLHKNRHVENWIYQADWNGDKCDGTGQSKFNWDQTKGNVAQIVYPYLGFGNIKFFVQDNATSNFILVHTIRYNNTYTRTQASNPSFKFKAYVAADGTALNVQTRVGSVGVFLNGKRIYLGPQFGVVATKSGVTTEANVIAIKNATTYNGVVNTGVLRLRSISVGSDGGNALGIFRILKGAVQGGTPVFTPVRGTTADNGTTITNGESVSSYDVAGTTGTGGYTVFNTLTARNESKEIDLTPYNLFISPGEVAIISAESALSSSFGISVNWNEDN